MIYIAHRGNIDGAQPELENDPDYIDLAIRRGYEVEVDLRVVGGKLYLGHDEPQYEITKDWLIDRSEVLWIHCKNIDALMFMRAFGSWGDGFHFFWHQEDDYTITSQGYIWAFPGKSLGDGKNVVCVMPERANYTLSEISHCYAVCSDDIMAIYKDKLFKNKS